MTKTLVDGTVIPTRMWYYVLDYMDSRRQAVLEFYMVKSLNEADFLIFLMIFEDAVAVDTKKLEEKRRDILLPRKIFH